MAITAIQRTELVSLIVGMFDAAPSAELMTGFVAQLEAGESVTDIANQLDDTAEFQSLYPSWLLDTEFAKNFTTTIMDGNADAAGLAVAITEVLALLEAGFSRGETAKIATDFLMAVDTADVVYGQAGQAVQNKTDVATYHTTQLLDAATTLESLQAVLANVDSTQQSVDDVKTLIDLGVTSVDSFDQALTVGQDNLTGTAGNDSFASWIFNNSNSAESGDQIHGGAGTDTLIAEIGSSQQFAISLKTYSVEVAHFRAQNGSSDNGDNDVTDNGIDKEVQIDAQDMNGTVEFWSNGSRANLTIEDIQNASVDTTIGWKNSDAGDVNYEVYFDNITAPGASTSSSQLFLEVLDLAGMATDGEPLKDNPYVGVSFSMTAADGTVTTVVASAADPVQTSYADLVAGINAILATEAPTVTAVLGPDFSAINSTDGISYTGTSIVLTNSGPEVLTGLGWNTNGSVPPSSNVHTDIGTVAPVTTSALTQTDVIFDHVGSGSKSGDFVAGEISQGAGGSGTPGIQQFNLEVRDSSWANEVRSTNGTLEVVNVVNGAASANNNGDLRIDVLNDVQVFNAASMTGDVNLIADLTEASIAKYLNRADTDTNGASDNRAFQYLTGTGNDTLNLDFEEELAAHEDFSLLISTGAGNDVIATDIKDTGALDQNTNWLDDQQTLNNLTIVSGAGDDTVTTTGEGDFIISTGSGNDTVYTNNDGTVSNLVNEVQTLTFAGTGATAGNIVVHGVTVALGAGISATAVGILVDAALSAHTDFTGVNGNVTNAAGVVTFTFDNAAVNAATATDGNIAAIVVSETVETEAAGGVVTTTPGTNQTLAAFEVTNITFALGGAVAAGETVIFDGVTTTLVDTDGSGTIEVSEATAQIAANTYTNFTVTDKDVNSGSVQFTANVATADLSGLATIVGADIAAGDITGTAITGNLSATPGFAAVGTTSAGTQGTTFVAGVAEVQTLTFTAANKTGTIVVGVDADDDGTIDADEFINVAVTENDTAIQVAVKAHAAVDAALGADFTVTNAALSADVVITGALTVGDLLVSTVTDGIVTATTTAAETTIGEIATTGTAAQWVVNAVNTEVGDLLGSNLTSNSLNNLLVGSQLTVTFSGATIKGASGVSAGVSNALVNGFESTVTIASTDALANERSINQAIKKAILEDDVLQEFLTVTDGPANTLIITSLVDGQFVAGDLEINLVAATAATGTANSLSASDNAAAKSALQDLNNTSNVAESDASLQTALDNAVASFTTAGTLTDLAMGTNANGTLISGSESVTESNNVVNLGSGNNVIVLGTDANSNDVIVISEAFGTDSILNFTAGTVAAADVLGFGTYLNTQTSVSGSTASAITVANTVTHATVAAGDISQANEVTVLSGFAQTSATSETFAGLDATNLLAAINDSNTGSSNYGNIAENTLEAAGLLTNLVGSTRDHIVMIESDLNSGEYKVFSLTSTDSATSTDFSAATLIGTLDFGDDVAALNTTNVTLAV